LIELMDDLAHLGWDERFAADAAEHIEQGFEPGRVAVEHRGAYTVFTAAGSVDAALTGKMRFDSLDRGELPAVGDWVMLERTPGGGRAVVRAVLPRRSSFSRKVAGETTEQQVLTANIDTVFLVTALNQDKNLRRIERYLALAWESGAAPVIVLTKADLCEDVLGAIVEVGAIAPGVSIHAVSVVTDEGFDELATYFKNNRTVSLLGSSGVGKSTIVNRLAGSDMKVQAIREDGKGRHTTSHREMILLPDGGIIVDTPGMRELQMWEANEGIDTAFADVTAYAAECRFNDCSHETEPGCAVKEAIEKGELSAERLESFRKLERELAFLERKVDKRLQHEEARKWRKLNAEARSRTRHR
jgi:ribosome biogenesis GTPase